MAVQQGEAKILAKTVLLSLSFFLAIAGCGEIGGEAPQSRTSRSVAQPAIGAASPNANATNVGLHVGIRVLVNVALTAATVTTNTTDTSCSGTFQVSADNFVTCVRMKAAPVSEFGGRIFYVKPFSALTASTTYKIRLTSLSSSNQLSFTTQAAVAGAFSNTRVDTNGLGSGTNSSITVHPTDPDTVYVTKSSFGFKHLWRSTNGGTSWADLDGAGATGIPDIPAWSLFIDPFNTNHLYLGTDLGVLHSSNGGSTWESINTYGMSNVQVQKLDYQPTTRTLVAFTHGRSVFKMVIP